MGEPVYKDTGFRLPIPAGWVDECLRCGEPIDGPMIADWAMGGAWHPECEPLAAAFRAAVAELAGGPRKTEDPFK